METAYLIDTLTFFLIIMAELTVLFIGISFLVGLLQEYVPPERIRTILERQRRGVGNVLGAAFGMVTPFCSCSTIPILVGLLNGGAPFGVTMSFLIASPLLNPVIVALLFVLLGIKTTVVYIAVVFTAAVLSGMIWERLGFACEYKGVEIQGGCCGGGASSDSTKDTTRERFRRAFGGAKALFRQVFVYLLLGAAVGALIYGFVPQDFVVRVAGADNPLAIPLAAVIGIPMYIRAETIIPVSSVLISKGMGIGAVIALIIGGAGASIPELLLLSAIFRRRLVAAFVITVLTVAIGAGYLFQFVQASL
ncbi:MAG: permease [Desulforudis sp.]|jgi:uncharacterized membrane protein YraQ (UPF0718 family)|nr:MAG: permease [Desulforudis sp.]